MSGQVGSLPHSEYHFAFFYSFFTRDIYYDVPDNETSLERKLKVQFGEAVMLGRVFASSGHTWKSWSLENGAPGFRIQKRHSHDQRLSHWISLDKVVDYLTQRRSGGA